MKETLQELKSVYENKLKENIEDNYCPFFLRVGENFKGEIGVLFVGKAENIKGDPNPIDVAFNRIHGDYIENIAENIRHPRSAYVRTLHALAKRLKSEKSIEYFARTNLYKLSNTKSTDFHSTYHKIFVDIFRKEIEMLKPRYIILLTSGYENAFLSELGKIQELSEEIFQYTYKKNIQTKHIKSLKIEGFDSIFITAFHPQGKPQQTDAIMKLIKI
ncbi:MAG: hypothetical protein LBE36_11350 [Flavobacteriaceae bacterium]|jgi:hypothetical protein|nr:hypothetical protein [Flavobacteriaceae bacterium]